MRGMQQIVYTRRSMSMNNTKKKSSKVKHVEFAPANTMPTNSRSIDREQRRMVMTTKTPQDRREVLLDFVQKYLHVHVHVSFAFAEKDEETKEYSYYTFDSFDELLEGLVEHGKMTDAEKHYILYEQLCQNDIEYAA